MDISKKSKFLSLFITFCMVFNVAIIYSNNSSSNYDYSRFYDKPIETNEKSNILTFKNLVILSAVCVTIFAAMKIYSIVRGCMDKGMSDTGKVGKISKFKYFLNFLKITHSKMNIFEACEKKDQGLLRAMIENGADVNQKELTTSRTPIDIICNGFFWNTYIVEIFINNGANIHKVDINKRTLLHIACKEDQWHTAKLLVESGAKLEQADCDGKTSLYIAVEKNNIDIAKLLITAGADVNKVDKYGKTMLYKAYLNNNARKKIFLRIMIFM